MSTYKKLQDFPIYITNQIKRLTYKEGDERYIRKPVHSTDVFFKSINVRRTFEINSTIQLNYINLPVLKPYNVGYINNTFLSSTTQIQTIKTQILETVEQLVVGTYLITASLRLGSNSNINNQIKLNIEIGNFEIAQVIGYPFSVNSSILSLRTILRCENIEKLQLTAISQNIQNVIVLGTKLSYIRIA